MKLTNAVLVNSVGSLNTLSELDLPVKTAFKLAKLSRKIDNLLQIYNDILKKLQTTHAELDENNQPKSVPNSDNPNLRHLIFKDPEAFQREYQELLLIENELDVSQLTIEELGDVKVKTSTLYQLSWLFED